MRKIFPTEFVFQVFSLLVAFIVVHAIYVAVVRPKADAFLAAEHAQAKADPNYLQQRSYYVVIRDYEQETCLVLMLWAMAILAFKGTVTYVESRDFWPAEDARDAYRHPSYAHWYNNAESFYKIGHAAGVGLLTLLN